MKDALHERFLRVWPQCSTASEAAAKLGLTPRQASRMAYEFRRNGCDVKKMKPGRRPGIDWCALKRKKAKA